MGVGNGTGTEVGSQVGLGAQRLEYCSRPLGGITSGMGVAPVEMLDLWVGVREIAGLVPSVWEKATLDFSPIPTGQQYPPSTGRWCILQQVFSKDLWLWLSRRVRPRLVIHDTGVNLSVYLSCLAFPCLAHAPSPTGSSIRNFVFIKTKWTSLIENYLQINLQCPKS